MYRICKRFAPKLKKDVKNTKFVFKVLAKQLSFTPRPGLNALAFIHFKGHNNARLYHSGIWTATRCTGAGLGSFRDSIKKEEYLSSLITTTQVFTDRTIAKRWDY